VIFVNDNLQRAMDTLYERLSKKLDKLLDKQNAATHNPRGRHPTTYPRTINLTSIKFTEEEQKLLDLGLQYNMQIYLDEPGPRNRTCHNTP
jgi:hypothetical protein